MNRAEILEALRSIDRDLAAAPWEADIDDEGLPGEEWTGKFYTGDPLPQRATAGAIGSTVAGPDGGAIEGRATAKLRNLVPHLIALLEAEGSS